MPFDAQQLWWPPVKYLYSELDKLRVDPASVSVDSLQTRLKELEPWLLEGLARFKQPNAASHKAVETEMSLKLGGRSIPVEAGLRQQAFDVSEYLALDEVQAYILLRRWAADADASLSGARLSSEQRREVAQYYYLERLRLLECTHVLVSYKLLEGDGSSPAFAAVQAVTDQLLSGGLEDNICSVLVSNLCSTSPRHKAGTAGEPASISSSSSSSTAGALIVASPTSSARGFAPAPSGVEDRDQLAQTVAERVALLGNLFLVYYSGRQCSVDQLVQLAGAFNLHLFAAPLPHTLLADMSQAKRAEHLAALVLIYALDIDNLLLLVSGGLPFKAGAHPLADAQARRRVDGAFRSWEPFASAAHAPVLLAWAAFLCLSSGLADAGGADFEYSTHAAKAAETGALGALADIVQQPSLGSSQPLAGELRTVILSLMAAAVAAFRLSPATLPPTEMGHVMLIMEGLFDGQEELCEQFWEEGSSLDEPLRHFLSETRNQFPAVPVPLLRLLAAMSSSPASATFAYQYLSYMPVVACIHNISDTRLRGVGEAGNGVRALEQVPIPGVEGLSLPEGSEGEVVPVPSSARDSAASGRASDAVDSAVLVQWRVPAAVDGMGQYLLLGRMAHCLQAIKQGCQVRGSGAAPAPALQASLRELAASVHLLARITSFQPGLGLELMQLPVMGPAAPAGPTGKGQDLLNVVSQALSVLAGWPSPPPEALGECLDLARALAASMPGRVLQDVAASTLLRSERLIRFTTYTPSAGGPQALDLQQSLPMLQHVQSSVEGATGRFPVTLAFLRLVAALFEAGMADAEMQPFLSFILNHVLASHGQWRYTERAQRWRLATAALRVLRCALSAQPAEQQSGSILLARALSQEGAAQAYLLPALPPTAGALEELGMRNEAEAAAIEETATEWLRLLAVLLPASMAHAAPAHLGTALFQLQDGGAPAPATVLASYLAYPLPPEVQVLAVSALHMLGVTCAQIPPRISFAGCLPQGKGGSIHPAIKAALLEPFHLARACAQPALFAAAAQLLITAVSSHPSLVDALFFPTGMAVQPPVDAGKENQAQANGSLVAARPSSRKPRKDKAKKEWSCLDGLWEMLQAAADLRAHHPKVLAALLQALLAMWQAGDVAYKPLELLRRQGRLWELLGSCLPEQAQRVLAMDGDDSAVVAERWQGQEEQAWWLASEAYALQILYLEAYQQPRPSAEDASSSGAWAVVDTWSREESGGRAYSLLKRYSGACTGGPLLKELRSAADGAVIQLLAAMWKDEALGTSFTAGASLLGQLHRRALPFLSQFPSLSTAAAELSRMTAEAEPVDQEFSRMSVDSASHITDEVRHAHFRQELAKCGLCEMLLSSAESSGMAVEEPVFGPRYLYDADALMQWLGPLWEQHLPAVQRLQSLLRATSVMASVEDARLLALQSLRALITISGKGSKPGPQQALQLAVPASLMQDVLAGLDASLRPLLLDSGANSSGSVSLVYSWHAASLAFAAEVAQLTLVTLRRWAAAERPQGKASAADLAADLGICKTVLDLTRLWLRGQSTVESWGADPNWLPVLQQHLSVLRLLNEAFRARVAPSGYTAPQPASGRKLRPQPAPLLLAAAPCEPATASQPEASSSASSAHQQEGAVSLTGAVLLLALSIAQHSRGAALLVEQGLLDFVPLFSRWLLAQEGAGLGSFASDSGPDSMRQGMPSGEAAPDYAGAYSRTGELSPVHQQWCTLLSLVGVLLRVLPGHADADRAAVAFLVTAEERLLLALEPPAATAQQPLTLAMLQETERSLFVLCGAARLIGSWQLALPSAPSAARRAATAFLLFAASPSRTARLRLHCTPVSPAEKALAKSSASLPVTSCWFKVCADSLGRPAEPAALVPAPSSSAEPGSPGRPSQHHAVRTSEFSVQVAVAIYASVGQALMFLAAVAPEVSEDEMAELGAEWPSLEVLLGLQTQCMALSYEVCQFSSTGNRQALRVCRMLLGILRATQRLQSMLAYTPDAAHATRLRDTLARLERALAGGPRHT
ncbi:hypothetical protein WJX72_000881 [[Myrmecia] bisecta]|uniref:Nucleoporin Nup188 N-terminal subdomain III domain-containing protein n=1 Tax=[Myrmecia] bisecta TaxID=41462 RepID=A0AAW1QE78_9CHLO